MGLFSLIGSIIGGNKQAKAADRAAQLQYDAALKGVSESARQFDATRADFASEQKLGEDAIGGFRGLVGLDGDLAQQTAIDRLRQSPIYKTLYGNGRDSILASSAATGGLRGGDTQGALYRLGEDTLSSVIRQQIGDYASTIGIGMGSDQAIGNFGADAVNSQNNLRNQGAGAMAQASLVRGAIAGQNWNNAGGFLDSAIGAALGGGGGGGGFNWGKLF